MTTFEYGDIVRCVKADKTTTGPLKVDALYVVEGVASHGKSIKIAGDWHKISRFEVVGKSDINEETKDEVLKRKMSASPAQMRDARYALSAAFVWAQSEEGEDYWREVYRKLGDYANRFDGLR